jgi:hemerythrin
MTAMENFNPTEGPLHWNDAYVLGFAPMDHIHEEFVELVGRLQVAPDEELAALLDRFAVHAQSHFEEENTWMRETGFPPKDCHIEQHDAVLHSVKEVQSLVAQGNFSICRALVRELAHWFPNHATHLDSALAHWMFKIRFGGKPVVLHKSISNTSSIQQEV